MDGSQVGVLEQRDEVRLSGLLQCHNGRRLEAKVRLQTQSVYFEGEYRPTDLEVLGDLTDEPLEGELPDQQFSRFLVPSDFTECDSSGTEAMGLLDTTSGGLHWKMVPQC